MAGWPESWFRRQNRAEFAAEWSVDQADFAAFLAAAIRAGSTPNGVFSLRLMADHRHDLVADLAATFGRDHDRALLERAFGPLQPIWLVRSDSVAQAVSRYRAEASGLWHRHHDGTLLETTERWNGTGQQIAYDHAAIEAYRAEAESDRQNWANWFERHNLSPRVVDYDEIATAPVETVLRLLAALDLAPLTEPKVGTARLADAVSRAWIDRFRADSASGI